jgi:PKD repeat protein
MRLLAAGALVLLLTETRAGAVDFAEYLLPGNACSQRSLANDFGNQRKFTIPLGMEGNLGRFLIMKGSDSTGFEEWFVDSEWFYLRSDTTWAWQNPANPAEWCDTVCGTGNGNPANCRKRWRGDVADWAYSSHFDPSNRSRPARWVKRHLNLPSFGSQDSFFTDIGIEGRKLSSCAACGTNFDSPSVRRWTTATRIQSWNGFGDVIELRITGGPGAGERYYFARGRGWVGFNNSVASPTQVRDDRNPRSCSSVAQADICSALGTIPPPVGGNSATVAESNSSVPASASANSLVAVRVQVANNGGTTWRAGSAHRLGAGPSNQVRWSGFSCGGYMNGVQDGRVFLCRDVAPNEIYDFTFQVQLPAAGPATFALRMVEDGVEWFGESQTWSIVVPSGACATSPLEIPADRYRLEVFNNKALSGNPVELRYDAVGSGDFLFNWGSGKASACAGVDNFGVRFLRRLIVDTPGDYELTTTTDDGVRLWVDGQLLIDRWIDQAPTSASVTRFLASGQHDVRMDYYENGGGAYAALKVVARIANRPPFARASGEPRSGAAPLSVAFDASTSSDPDSDALSFAWGWGDGAHGSGVTAMHTYERVGSFVATLTVSDGKGGSSTAELPIAVSDGSPGTGENLIANPGFESGFSNGLGTSWLSWRTRGAGYWKASSRLGRIGSGSYASGSQVLSSVKRLNPKVILLEGNALGMAAEFRRTFPDAILVGRLFIDPLASQYLSNPEFYGRKHAEDCVRTSRSEIDAWQGLNEPYINGIEEARRVARFEKAFSDRIQELGKKSVVLNLAVGNPGDMETMLLPEVVDLLATADYAGYHAYGGNKDQLLNGPQSPWFANRWRFYAQMYRERGLRTPPVIYTEVNTFNQWKGNVPPGVKPRAAWEIRDDLIAFEEDSRKDPWAVGMAIFLFGSSSAEFAGRETANEPVIYEGSGDHNLENPADAKTGLFSQQFGTDGGEFEGGLVQRVSVRAGVRYRLASATKYETRLPRSRPSFWVGYDLTGQTSDSTASSIVWSPELITAEERETDIWYAHGLEVTASGPQVSIWFRASPDPDAGGFRVFVDEVKLEEVQP